MKADAPASPANVDQLFPGDSELAGLMRRLDWSSTALGPPEDWPENLRVSVSLCLTSRIPVVMYWGREFTVLDFSRIEAGRIQASYEPTDVAASTAELASVFRSAMEKAGLKLIVDCPPLPEPVYIDREMWEKIVLNLLSNAFKFTFEGEIKVQLRWLAGQVELSVADTGTGIPEAELPRIFERFHRVPNVRSRTHEGTGIGLALVQELVHLHGGEVRVRSTEGRGTTFQVSIPTGHAHLPTEKIGARRTLETTSTGATPFVEEALRWLPPTPPPLAPPPHPPSGPRSRVVLADDNADMREYVNRLLVPHFDLETAADGQAALELIRQRPPDLVLIDVMMPHLDGYGLLQQLREDPRTPGRAGTG